MLGTALGALSMLGAPAGAAPGPVAPIELDRGTAVTHPRAWAAPNGDQIVSYKLNRAGAPAPSTGLRLRQSGGEFGSFDEIGLEGNAEEMRIAFAPDGSAYALFGVATTGASALGAERRAGTDRFGAARSIPGCGRFTSIAYSPLGALGIACSTPGSGVPPDQFGYGRRDGIGHPGIGSYPMPKVYDPFIQPKIAFGPDGTMAVAATYEQATVSPPPPGTTRGLRVIVRSPDDLTGANSVTDSVPLADDLALVGLEVLPNGTVAALIQGYSAGASAARLRLLDPPWTASSSTDLDWDLTGGMGSDRAGNLHILVAADGGLSPPTDVSMLVKPPGDPIGAPVPVGLGPEERLRGLVVAPDGVEHVISSTGSPGRFAVRSRPAGAATFGGPVELAGEANEMSTAMTPEGDLLAAWSQEESPGEQRIMVGGLDGGEPPEITSFEVPRRALVGLPVELRATARDSMGVGSYSWDLGDGNTAAGPSPRHAYAAPGRYTVRLTVTDRAGNETERTARVEAQRGVPLAPRIRLATPKRLKFKALKRRGVRVRVTADVPVKVKATLRLRRGRRLVPLAARDGRRARAVQALRLRPNKRRLGKPRKLRLRLQVVATTDEGGRAKAVRNIRVRR